VRSVGWKLGLTALWAAIAASVAACGRTVLDDLPMFDAGKGASDATSEAADAPEGSVDAREFDGHPADTSPLDGDPRDASPS
jgi:hypothetical protein